MFININLDEIAEISTRRTGRSWAFTLPDPNPYCGSDSLFTVEVVNEIVEMLKMTGAEVDFADHLGTLEEAGNIAALLRYRLL
jgi:hypothetical protein